MSWREHTPETLKSESRRHRIGSQSSQRELSSNQPSIEVQTRQTEWWSQRQRVVSLIFILNIGLQNVFPKMAMHS